jgi:uncharacterized repeat protein (TIGR03803 family)
MQRTANFLPRLSFFVFVLAAVVLVSLPTLAAAGETILHSFYSAPLGYQPNGGLISDAAGNLYGTTAWGGNYAFGNVYELIPNSQGGWTEKVIYSFNDASGSIYSPTGKLTFDSAGNLYGATTWGGSAAVGAALGGVFKLAPTTTGQWKETTIHVFPTIGSDGYSPNGGMVFDQAGNLYGTTTNQNSGTAVFELSPASNGFWTYSAVSHFDSTAYPNGDLVFDQAGNLYGTTMVRDNNQYGTVFELTPSSAGWNETILYSFSGGADGAYPTGGVIFDSTGSLYGTAEGGGSATGCNSCGVVFKLTHGSSGWTESVLHSFQGRTTDGDGPNGTLIFDGTGNLYGTTGGGGTGALAQGTVFELTPASGGAWTENLLWSFSGGSDGGTPVSGVLLGAKGQVFTNASKSGTFGSGTVIQLTAGQGGQWKETTIADFPNPMGNSPAVNLVADAAGNLYGTAAGGTYNYGVVYELAKSGNGSWQEKVLYNFPSGVSIAGAGPSALIFDSAGNLYGETAFGEGNHLGTVFELSPSSGGWIEKTIGSFNGTDGSSPVGGLVFDQAGNLYGTTQSGGNAGCSGSCGTVFELTPASGGLWIRTVLYRFTGVSDGGNPVGGVILDAAGNLYGTTPSGGPNNHGTVFQLSPGSGGWTESVLHQFTGQNGDGRQPKAGLLFDQQGNLYGTTSAGGFRSGDGCCGTVFQLSPTSGGWNEAVLIAFSPTEGGFPVGTLIFDPAGNLYGATQGTGVSGSIWGSIFELSPKSGGAWSQSVLHQFAFPAGLDPDGYGPQSSVIMDSLGNLYGTTVGGGTHRGGVIYQITP